MASDDVSITNDWRDIILKLKKVLRLKNLL